MFADIIRDVSPSDITAVATAVAEFGLFIVTAFSVEGAFVD